MKKFQVGLQLYSVRDEMEKDMDACLKKVKEIGYDYVEMAGYFGKSAEEIREMLDRYGLSCISIHQTLDFYEEKGQEAIDFVKKLGITYSAVPWYYKEKMAGTSGWQETVETFTKYGKMLKENGIQLLYHNHNFEFETYQDKFLLDWLYESVPAEYLHPQLDTCWAHYAGYDPAEYIRKYAGRMDVVHLKDFVCTKLGGGPVYKLIDSEGNPQKAGDVEDNGFEMRPVGYGVQDFPSILAACEEAGVEAVIVEQDEVAPGSTPMEDAAKSRAYLKTLGL